VAASHTSRVEARADPTADEHDDEEVIDEAVTAVDVR
jgi:hypothetical protein